MTVTQVPRWAAIACAATLAAVGCHGQARQHAIVAGHHFPAPTAPEDRVAVEHQESVAGVGQRRGVVAACFVERPEGQLVAPVVHVVKQSPVAPARVGRRQQEGFGLSPAQSAVAAELLLEHDDPVAALGISVLLVREGLEAVRGEDDE